MTTTEPLSALTILLSRHTRRRAFILALGGAAVMVPPLVARTQQGERVQMALVSNLPETLQPSRTEGPPDKGPEHRP
jgi:hypothetical protein